MAITLPNIAYVSGSFTVATACSLPEFSAPFPGINIVYLLTQEFMQYVNSYTALALDTPHPDFTDFLLVSEDKQRDMGGGIVRWTRTYAKFPQTYDQPSAFSYNFIGYFTGGGTSAIYGRERFVSGVAARIQFDYFRLDLATGNIYDALGAVVYGGTAGVLPSVANVPILPAQVYFAAVFNSVWAGLSADAIGYGPTSTTPQILYPTPYNSVQTIGGIDYYYPPAEAYPTREVYESWIKQTATVQRYTPGVNTDDVGTFVDTGIFEIVAQASQVSRWMGNFIERQTIFILPQ